MIYRQSKQKLLPLFIFLLSIVYTQDCEALNSSEYGDCEIPLGYVWSGYDCILMYGCNMGEDEGFFFDTYEECDISCNSTAYFGDLNNDSFINIIDIVQLVNIILNDDTYDSSGDLNFDEFIDIIDVVALVNLILSNNELRDTWEIINQDIITPKCASCHYTGSFYSELSDLILEEDVAYEQLNNRAPNNQSANENGLTLLSNEGGLYGLLISYLWEKINVNNEIHFYNEHPQYGEIMPLGGPYLTNGELNFIEDWIWAEAPEIGIVADPLILNDNSVYEPPEFEVLDPPSLGVQYHIGPFEVLSNTEREFLYYVPPLSNEYYVSRVEMSMAPGSHHFIAYQFSDNTVLSEPEEYTIRDFHLPYATPFDTFMNLTALNEHVFVFGTQWPSWDYSFPDGVALQVDSEYGLDLNPHYFNYTNDTIFGEIYFNIHTSLIQDVEHIAGILQLGSNDIYLPPNQETTLEEVFSTNQIINGMNIDVPNGATSLNIFQLFSHAHQLMTRFDILLLHANGEEELLYTALDYQHPPILQLDPPLEIQLGQSLIARATYNNTTDEVVTFGLFSTSEMMLIFGLGYFE